jgi:hypothetical protein
MIGHAQYEAMLVCRDELTLAERIRLEAHLAGCAACRGLEAIYAENRDRLRTMTQVRPPEELRAAILAAAESTRPVFGGMALFLPFLIVPLSLALVGLGITYGRIAWLGICLGLFGFIVVTAWWIERRMTRAQEMPEVREPGRGFRELARAVGWDTLGIAIGFGLIGLFLLAMRMSGGH